MSGIYIHIPFCERKCVYCDFYSIADHSMLPGFINALIEEIKLCGKYSTEEDVETIYFGGGTPSLLQSDDLSRILSALRINFSIKTDAEITLEANPGTVSLPVLLKYRQLGINRLSIGIQSFNDEDLKLLSRIHTSGESYEAFYDAREAGFSNISIDLIYALPNQRISGWHETLGKGVGLMPEHISAYNLTIEEGTPLGKFVRSDMVTPLSDEDEALFFMHTMEFLRAEGYVHYEVSNYAKPDYQSKHNMNYWNHMHYLGFGPSAHSFWGKKRWWNASDVGDYIRNLQDGRLPIADSEELSTRQLLDEIIMLGLRTGFFDLDRIIEAGGRNIIEKSRSYIDEIDSQKLITREKETIRLTDRGFLFCDEIAKRLLNLI
jgi:oxygen-independent coproporphyrinogen-3 oxidase